VRNFDRAAAPGALAARRMRVRRWTALLLCAALASQPLHAQTTVAGFTPGSFRVTETGAASYTIPIRVPPGIAGMEPKLALIYNSQSGNGLLGIGWSLQGLSAVTRCPRTIAQDNVRGAVNYDSDDRYCLDGQRLIAISGVDGADGTEYRTELESFTKLISYGTAGNGPAWFKVWTKSGQILEYGNTPDSRIEAQGKSTVKVWALNRVQDTKANYMTVTYTEDNSNGDYYPARIDYTFNGGTGAQAQQSVTFQYVSRADQTPLFHAASLTKTMNRLATIKTFTGAVQAREYRLSYTASSATGRSRLDGVTECSGDGSQCLAQIAFAWQNSATDYTTWTWSSQSIGAADNYEHRFADVNGDGKADWIQIQRGANNGYVGLSNGDGSFPTWTWSSQSIGAAATYEHQFADVNGDGKADWIQIQRGTDNGYVGLSSGPMPDLLTTVNNGLGATVTVTYKPITDSTVYSKDSGSSYPRVDIQAPMSLSRVHRRATGARDQLPPTTPMGG
jgi:hypothetical protein